MAKLAINSLVILIFFQLSSGEVLEKCVRETDNPCLCKIDDYNKIDISTALSQKDDFVHDTEFTKNITYFFHGCYDQKLDYQKLNLTVKNVNDSHEGSLLKYDGNSSRLEVIAKAHDINFNTPTNLNGYALVYSNQTNNNKSILAMVRLICDNFDKPFIKIVDISSTFPVFVFSSPKVCVQTEEAGLGGFTLFMFLLFFSALMYLVGGACLLYFFRGARGIELIPNVDFWTSLPTRMRNGLVYILSGCRTPYVTTEETYDRI